LGVEIMPATRRSVLLKQWLLGSLPRYRADAMRVAAGGLGTAEQIIPRQEQFYLSSTGFKVHFANDAAGKKALHALPRPRQPLVQRC
jgi:hypothetical protein